MGNSGKGPRLSTRHGVDAQELCHLRRQPAPKARALGAPPPVQRNTALTPRYFGFNGPEGNAFCRESQANTTRYIRQASHCPATQALAAPASEASVVEAIASNEIHAGVCRKHTATWGRLKPSSGQIVVSKRGPHEVSAAPFSSSSAPLDAQGSLQASAVCCSPSPLDTPGCSAR